MSVTSFSYVLLTYLTTLDVGSFYTYCLFLHAPLLYSLLDSDHFLSCSGNPNENVYMGYMYMLGECQNNLLGISEFSLEMLNTDDRIDGVRWNMGEWMSSAKPDLRFASEVLCWVQL